MAAGSAYPTMVLTLAYTGLRWGEATGLRVRSVNRLRRRFVIEENAVMIAYEIHVGTPKTHERRSVPYPARLAPMIEQACAGKGPEGLPFGDGTTTCATQAHRDGSPTPSAVRRLWTHRSRG